MNSNGVVVTPDVGRFVCESDSSMERIKEVSSVWRAYYCALAFGSGVRTNEHDCARVAAFGQSVECSNYLIGCVGGCCGRSVAMGVSGLGGKNGRLLGECGTCERDTAVCGSDGMDSGVREVHNNVGDEDELGSSECSSKEFSESDVSSAFPDKGTLRNSDLENSGIQKNGVLEEKEKRFVVEETKTERNRRWRAEKKVLKKKRQFMNQDWRRHNSNVGSTSSMISEADIALKDSLKAKWKVQNELAVEKARRELEVLKVSDIEQEVKRYRTKVSAATERNMVSIEKTHAKLRQTGNLPEERSGGFAETVVSGVPGLESGSGTISPDSSASMAEFRACQKALLDAEREIAEYKRKVKIASEKYGFPLEQVDFLDKEVWTDTQTNQDILDDIYPNGYGKDTSLFEDGKFRAIGV